MKVLIIGATGMLGYSLFQNLSDCLHLDVYGTVRSIEGKAQFFSGRKSKLFKNTDVSNLVAIERIINEIKPAVVINCVGLIKQYSISKQYIESITVNSLLPHQLARICSENSCKLIHFSTDCIFDGTKGLYCEDDLADACDLYGRLKYLGEVDYAPHLTIRTSIIGHELNSHVSLVDWFLSQEVTVKGFSQAIFSGLPTCVIAKILIDRIIPNAALSGLYQLSVNPIDKFTLLNLIAEKYHKEIDIIESTELKIDRSLDSTKLRNELSLETPSWKELISDMHNDYMNRYKDFK